MAKIEDLSSIDSVAAGDLLAVHDTSNADTRKASLTTLATWLQNTGLTFGGGRSITRQSASPSATGFTVTVTSGSDDIWLVLTPAGAYAAGTITLPAVGKAVDTQEVLVNCTKAVTSLTIGANGAAAVIGAPTGLTANQSFRLKFDAAVSTWYNVGN